MFDAGLGADVTVVDATGGDVVVVDESAEPALDAFAVVRDVDEHATVIAVAKAIATNRTHRFLGAMACSFPVSAFISQQRDQHPVRRHQNLGHLTAVDVDLRRDRLIGRAGHAQSQSHGVDNGQRVERRLEIHTRTVRTNVTGRLRTQVRKSVATSPARVVLEERRELARRP